jgi:flavin reductase (DIM6/NTAB) family NADH-FMN oxidoreductase RutF
MSRASAETLPTYFYYPRPVGVVGVADPARGTVNFAAATWITPLASTPPLLGVCLSPGTHTHHLLLSCGEFTLSLLEHRHASLVAKIGHLSGRQVDKVQALGLEVTAAETIKGGFLAEAYAAVECTLQARHHFGDQTLMVGEVQRVQARAEGFDEAGVLRVDCIWPLLYLGDSRFVTTDPATVVHDPGVSA